MRKKFNKKENTQNFSNLISRPSYYEKRFETYNKELELLSELIMNDLGPASPEIGDVETDLVDGAWKSQSEKCNMITRYFEDDKYARSYSTMSYHEGIMVLFDKSVGTYNIIVIGEDDGCWFPSDYYYGIVTDKSTFICLLTEAISIFNSNFNSEPYKY